MWVSHLYRRWSPARILSPRREKNSRSGPCSQSELTPAIRLSLPIQRATCLPASFHCTVYTGEVSSVRSAMSSLKTAQSQPPPRCWKADGDRIVVDMNNSASLNKTPSSSYPRVIPPRRAREMPRSGLSWLSIPMRPSSPPAAPPSQDPVRHVMPRRQVVKQISRNCGEPRSWHAPRRRRIPDVPRHFGSHW